MTAPAVKRQKMRCDEKIDIPRAAAYRDKVVHNCAQVIVGKEDAIELVLV